MLLIYRPFDSIAFEPYTVSKSFADAGLWLWDPITIRDLCKEHCLPTSQLNGSHELKKMENIMKRLGAYQKAERYRITSIGRLEGEGLIEENTKYQLRKRKSMDYEENEGGSRSSVSVRKKKSSKVQQPSKRSRTVLSIN